MLYIFQFIFSFVLSSNAQQQNKTEFIWESSPSHQQKNFLQNSERKIFWWNIGCGVVNKKLQDNGSSDSLYTNIGALAQSTGAPEVLVLGEHCPGRMPQKTLDILNSKYQHKFHQLKSNPFKQTQNGIIVFSKKPLVKIKTEILNGGLTQKENMESSRTFILLRVTDSKGDYYISPTHLYNPWGKMKKSDLLIEALGKDNPNYRQADHHVKLIQETIDIQKDPLIIIGDFNSAKGVLQLIDMAAYSLYTNYFYDRGESAATFPTSEAIKLGNNYPSVTIDHVFTNSFTQGISTTLPLKGSDHYPILFQF